MRRFCHILCASLITVLAFSGESFAEETQTLLGRIAEWQYPGSKIHGATMSDAATVDDKGRRTVPSIQCKTVMTTNDPIAKVVEYYKSQLKPTAEADTAKSEDKSAPSSGRSVTFHSDSENRPVEIHIILVNMDQTSTTLVISRAEAEAETHIAWTQYETYQPGK